jgi:hypothetical protein
MRSDASPRRGRALHARRLRALRALIAEHAEDDVNGIVMESDFFFLGRQMKHGGSKKRKIMLFKTGKGRIEDRKRDAHTILSKADGRDQERYLHYDFKDLTSYIARYNWYAIRDCRIISPLNRARHSTRTPTPSCANTVKRNLRSITARRCFCAAMVVVCV